MLHAWLFVQIQVVLTGILMLSKEIGYNLIRNLSTPQIMTLSIFLIHHLIENNVSLISSEIAFIERIINLLKSITHVRSGLLLIPQKNLINIIATIQTLSVLLLNRT